MPEDISYPTVRYYADGGAITVATQEEYDALAPGHAATPDGPFPEPKAPASRSGGRRQSEPRSTQSEEEKE